MKTFRYTTQSGAKFEVIWTPDGLDVRLNGDPYTEATDVLQAGEEPAKKKRK